MLLLANDIFYLIGRKNDISMSLTVDERANPLYVPANFQQVVSDLPSSSGANPKNYPVLLCSFLRVMGDQALKHCC